MLYLDHHATTPCSEAVLKVMYDFSTQYFANISSSHTLGQEAKKHFETIEGEAFNESKTRKPCALMPSKKDRKRYTLLKKL